MVYSPWLYDIALHRPKLTRGVLKRIRRDVELEPSFQDHLNDFIQFATLHFKNVEKKLQQFAELCGVDPAPSHLLLSLIVSLCFIVLLVRKIKQRIRHRRLYGYNAFPPLAPASIMETISALKGEESPWFFKQCAERVGPVFRLKVPFLKGPMFVAVGDLDTTKEILQDPKTIKPEALYASNASIAGGPNIVISDGHHWMTSRTGVAPALLKTHLDRLHKVCKEATENWIQRKLEPFIDDGRAFDFCSEFLLLTISIICKAAFEYKVKDVDARMLVKEFQVIALEFARNGVKNPLRTWFGIFLPSVRRARLARTRVQAIAKHILETYKKKPKHMRSQKDTIISCIEKNQNYKDDSHRIADIMMFLFAGHDTTAYSLSWTLLELARHPEEMKKLQEALNGTDDALAQDILKDVVREGMRLRPVHPGVGMRITGRDFYLKDKLMVIPKGSQVLFPSIILTRQDVEDAEEFRPSRWQEHPDKSFLLFSTGRRNCVGQSLALAEITWVLSRLCAKYDFEVIDEGHQEFCVTLKCVGATLKARRRQDRSKIH